MKPSGEWGIRLRKKISESIQAKTFISLLVLLAVCCMIIYSVVMVFLPKNYHARLESQVTSDFYELTEKLERDGWEDSTESLLEFSMKNNASVRIQNGENREVFSVNFTDTEDLGSLSLSAASLSCLSSFTQEGEIFQLFAVVSLVAVSQSYEILRKLLPLIGFIIILISVLGAFICSRYYSKPLVHICAVARQMTSLDLTWKCEIKRRDEIGILALSLNEMSRRLGNALESLQKANQQLKEEIEKEREQEKQRIDFFTSVSHELKTPIAVMKGELEGMIYQVGEYRDRNVYLRHCLKTAGDMEKIVKEILLAARMGGSDFQLAAADLDLSEMLRKSCYGIRGRLEDKQMELRLDIEEEFHYRGDGRLLEKVFSNVLGNAAVYSPPGAIITVSLREGRLTVENTGVHIAEEDLKRVFTPFYRAEKSRSRNSGGSGLGLYITKTILEHHGVFFRLENSVKGVRFTAVFSKE